ncbi:alternate-type signal peptide domain-containing protein [Arthrobacter alpinus]|uniref:alternate-type signal peptide domain-containing protein n=1 Tax=Arthrobacter alpinus TaxID=656366 RepID=UPI0007848F26|nr:alternate-type signal peptide domain-containing protein [Arthrobacter alpinus]
MNKLAKGAIAAGAAGILLLGGLGTLAFWNDSTAVNGGNVTTGTLALSDAVCDGGWVYAVGNAGVGAPVGLIVPGDTISKECTFAITATGDNLEADLVIPAEVTFTSSPDAPTLNATASASYTTAGGVTGATVTSANDGDIVTATIKVVFPFGDAALVNTNDTQGILSTLDDITVSLAQTES